MQKSFGFFKVMAAACIAVSAECWQMTKDRRKYNTPKYSRLNILNWKGGE